jgi:NMD protein affecting ribosome stability and mRNA decay
MTDDRVCDECGSLYDAHTEGANGMCEECHGTLIEEED